MSCLGYIRDYTSSYVWIVINQSLAKGLKDEDCNGIHPRLTFNGMACGGVLLCPRIVHFLRSLEFLMAELSAFQSKKALLYALPAECAGALYNMCETCGRHLVLKRLAHALEAALQERLAGGLSQLSFDVLKGDLEMWNHPGTSKFKTSNSAFAAWRSTVRAAGFLVKEHIRFEKERPVGAGASVSSLAGISGRHWQRPLQFCALGHAMFNLLRRNIRRRLLSFQQKTVERTGTSFWLLT